MSNLFSDFVRRMLVEDEEEALSYLRSSWISSAMSALRAARRRAGLSQQQVADRLGTKQPAIARIENDLEGSISLHKFVDFALACGMLPVDLVMVPSEEARQFSIDQPDPMRTQLAIESWRTASSVPASTSLGASLSVTALEPTKLDCAPGWTHYVVRMSANSPNLTVTPSFRAECIPPTQSETRDFVTPRKPAAYSGDYQSAA